MLVFAAAFLLRLVYLADIHDNPFFRAPVIDAEHYHQMAQGLAGDGIGRAPFQMPPGYPLLLALVYRVFGVSFVAAHVLQFLLGAGTTAFAFALGRRVGGTAVGALAAAFVGASPSLLYLEGDLLATPLSVFLDVLSLWFLARWSQEGRRGRDLWGAGLALGLSAIVMPLALVIVPAIGYWTWRQGRGSSESRRARTARAGAFLLAVLLPVAPVTIRNLVASREMVLVSANGGINLWMGNNPDMWRTATLRPGPEWRAMQELPLREAGLVPSSARDRWFARQAVRFWRREPGLALRRTAAKALLLVHDHEIMRDFDFYYFREHYSVLLLLLRCGFAGLLALATVGFAAWWRARGAAPAAPRPWDAALGRLLVLFLACYAAGIVAFFVTARYRAPLLPALAVFAALGTLVLVARARARDWPAVLRLGAVGVAAFALSRIDFLGVDRVDTVEAEYRVATTYEKRGLFQDALLRYDQLLERAPDHALAGARAGVCAQILGRPQEAVRRYEAVLERHPEYAEVAVNLANLAMVHGDRDAAAHYFAAALDADPYLPQAHASYGVFLLRGAEPAAAVAPLAQALAYDPTWEALRVDYASALLASGDLEQARREIERAARVLPPSDQLELVRGDVYQAMGRRDEARAAWENGRRLNPENQALRGRLAALGGGS